MMICERSGASASARSGAADFTNAYQFLIQDFQVGRLGRITLDRLPRRMLPTATRDGATAQQGAAAAAAALEEQKGAGGGGGDDASGADGTTQVYTIESTDVAADEPPHVQAVLKAVHSTPHNSRRADDTVISRKRGPVAREAMAATRDHRLMTRDGRPSTPPPPSMRAASGSSGSAADRRRQSQRPSTRMSGQLLSRVLQSRV